MAVFSLLCQGHALSYL